MEKYIKVFLKTLVRPGRAILLLFFLISLLSIFSFSRGLSASIEITLFFGLLACLFILCEISFRLGYRFFYGESYDLTPKLNFSAIYVKPHPYIPYVMKSNFATEAVGKAKYSLHKGRFSFGRYSTNNLGYCNGIAGDRSIAIPKPDGLLRINCLGASTTGNYIEENGVTFSYPLELERLLKLKIKDSFEVNNCGQGGYNSADILVRFALEGIDLNPDVVILYHAYNDIQAYLKADFKSDYSHHRCNLGENYWKLALAAKIPLIPIKFVNYLFSKWFPISLRVSLLDQVSIGEIDIAVDYSLGLKTYSRNLQHIIDLCRASNIEIILSTYCHFLHDSVKEDATHRLYSKIVREENKIVRDLALKNKLQLVDNAKLIPQEERYFLDTIHFTPDGMKLLARNFAVAIDNLKIVPHNYRMEL